MQVFVNGSIVPENQAFVPVQDAGFQHAVGLFETMAARHGKVFRLNQHLERLALSARELGLAQEMHVEPLAQAVQATLAANNLADGRIRLTLTAGPVSLLRAGSPGEPTPTLTIVVTPPTPCAPAAFEEGVMTLIAPPLANPFDPAAGHKTLAYWSRLRCLRQAASVGAQEAICLNITNHLAGGMVSNIFLMRGGELLTPIARGEEARGAVPAPVLPGVTRAALFELAESRGIEVRRQMLTVTDLLDADEVFLTNSNWQVLPVTAVEKKSIADGEVGPMTADLRAWLLDLIEQECGGG